jgi:hypothetical protein
MLTLGKAFDRSYKIRIPFLNGFYELGIFFSKNSSFLLFDISPDFSSSTDLKKSVKINMFKNLEASKFCETFFTLHSYRKQSLDIVNQFESIKPEYQSYVNLSLNETITLSKVRVSEGSDIFDLLTIYGFSMTAYANEFVFIIAERQNIIKRLKKKVVRSTGIQISTAPALQMLEEFYEDSLKGHEGEVKINRSDNVIRLEEENTEVGD